jgi:formiminotetrahydrofolate cyclodeaminase
VSELMASLARALSKAADVPMEIVELAAQVAGLAAPLAAVGNPALRGDAVAAALLAQAGARAAATLVAINLADSPDDLRPARAFDLLASIAQAVEKASAEH